MNTTATLAARPARARLDWESGHFQLEAAQLSPADLDESALTAALCHARADRVRLVVWPAAAGRAISARLLSEFGGTLVDRKLTFGRSLTTVAEVEPHSAAEIHVVPYAGRSVSNDLYEVALASGVYSRFKVEAHFAAEKFAAMYRVWIERSVRGELAGAVLVAHQPSHANGGEPSLAGMVTVSQADGAGSIGLIAVAPAARGLGVGSGLIAAAHRWMQAAGATEARVVTQGANLPACRLYERAGYRVVREQPYYHFWL